MVESADIKDGDRLEAWLKDQPREVSVWIAARAAARVLPTWWQEVLTKDWARDRDLTALPVLRSLLISSVGATVSTEDMKAARVANAGAAMAYTNTHMGHAFAATDAAAKVAPYAAANAAASAAVANVADAVSDAAAAAADAGSNAAAAARSVWNAVRIDAEQGSGGEILRFLPLWADATNPLAKMWQEVQAKVQVSEAADHWQFWIDWYQAQLDGRPMLGDEARTWEMLEKIALIDPKDWDQGPEVVNPLIARIWVKYKSIPDPVKSLNEMLADQPDATKVRIHEVRQVMDRAKRDLPPTFDAILGLILLELERLQHKNYESELEQLEGKRQISVFLTLYEAVERMQALLPNENPATTADAEEMEGLLRLYFDRFRGLCREKVDDVANGVWSTGAGVLQGGLILGSASLATTFGLPAMAGVAVGSLVFAPDRAGQIIKVAKETTTKQV